MLDGAGQPGTPGRVSRPVFQDGFFVKKYHGAASAAAHKREKDSVPADAAIRAHSAAGSVTS